MRAFRSEKPEAVAVSPRLEAFLEMLAAERGAARLTLSAYRNDLIDRSRNLSIERYDLSGSYFYTR